MEAKYALRRPQIIGKRDRDSPLKLYSKRTAILFRVVYIIVVFFGNFGIKFSIIPVRSVSL